MKAAVFSPLVYVLSHGFLFVPKGFISVHKVADRWAEEGKKIRHWHKIKRQGHATGHGSSPSFLYV
jgi:hypothetical protein